MYHGTCALCGSQLGYRLSLYPTIVICTWCYMAHHHAHDSHYKRLVEDKRAQAS
jgi:hypothetical protein